jgi:hypothetical protein
VTAKHTPGPWHVGGKNSTIVFSPGGFAVADAKVFHKKHGHREAEANAQLMASAPDLVENLADCVSVLENLEKMGVRLSMVALSIMDKSRAAISKATPFSGTEVDR